MACSLRSPQAPLAAPVPQAVGARRRCPGRAFSCSAPPWCLVGAVRGRCSRRGFPPPLLAAWSLGGGASRLTAPDTLQVGGQPVRGGAPSFVRAVCGGGVPPLRGRALPGQGSSPEGRLWRESLGLPCSRGSLQKTKKTDRFKSVFLLKLWRHPQECGSHPFDLWT